MLDMKNKKNIIITILTVIVVVQFFYIFIDKKKYSEYKYPINIVNSQTKILYDRIIRFENNLSKKVNYTPSDGAKYCDTLNNYIVEYGVDNYIEKEYKSFLHTNTSLKDSEIDKLIFQLKSAKKEDRKYICSITKYFVLSYLEYEYKGDFIIARGYGLKFEPVKTKVKLGEDYETYLSFFMLPIKDTIRVDIWGYKDTIIGGIGPRTLIKVPTKTKGHKRFKGFIHLVENGKGDTNNFPFIEEYDVE